MKGLKFYLFILLLAAILVGDIYLLLFKEKIFELDITNKKQMVSQDTIKLPQPRTDSGFSLEQALYKRRSVRKYSDKDVSLNDLSQLLWAAQGLTSGTGRTAPSAGGLYPLEVYVVGSFGDFEAGVYHYINDDHSLERVKEGDFRSELAEAAVNQGMVKEAPLNFVITGIYERTTGKYKARGIQYAHLEAGHAGQNIYLQATALRLGTVSVGAFSESEVREILGVKKDEVPLYIFPVGHLTE